MFQDSAALMLYLGLVFLFITIVGAIGNAVVIAVIAVNSQLHDSTNFLICNLAIADLCFLTCCVPITAYSYINSWQFSQSVCYGTVTLQYVTCYVSVWTLVLLSVERFLSIRKPQIAKSMKRNRTVLYVCFSIWLLVFALNLPQMQAVGVLTFEYNGTIVMACVDSLSIANENATTFGARVFYWGFNLFAYVLPLALSTVFYLLLVSKLWVATRVESKSSARMKRHATKMVFIVILTFGFCWFPQNLRFFLRGLNYPNPTFWETDGDLLLVVQSTIQVMAYANSCINPILYSALSERFRDAMKCTWRRFVFCDHCNIEHRHQSVMVRCEQSSMRSGALLGSTRTTRLDDLVNRSNKISLSPRSSLGVSSGTDMTCGSGGRRRYNEIVPLKQRCLASISDGSPSYHSSILPTLSVKRLMNGGTATKCVEESDTGLAEGDIFL